MQTEDDILKKHLHELRPFLPIRHEKEILAAMSEWGEIRALQAAGEAWDASRKHYIQSLTTPDKETYLNSIKSST